MDWLDGHLVPLILGTTNSLIVLSVSAFCILVCLKPELLTSHQPDSVTYSKIILFWVTVNVDVTMTTIIEMRGSKL